MFRHRAILFLIAVCAVFAPESSADDRLTFFEKRIRPVLVEQCNKCHAKGARNIRGGLLLDSRDGWTAGGDSGPAIIPGDPDDSLLLSALRHESFEMPPDKRLPESVIADFEQWIRDGAIDPREGETLTKQSIDLVEGRQFWSFRPVRQPTVPGPESDWAATPIDRFVQAKLEEKGRTPAPDATAAQILRRLSFGLTGLPPRPAEIQQFEKAWQVDPAQAIEFTTDKLLASPRYGERWGRHWLDVARFAESSGGGRSLMFPDAWRFRDYAIRSFNTDKPFDQLIREHIAGDLLPSKSDDQFNDQLCGSAYLALGAVNYELQDKELLQMEVVDEQIDTIGRSFLGLTLGCARCHDHKFDPIPTREYYALAGIFRSTQSLVPGNVSGQVKTGLRDKAWAAQMASWKNEKATLVQQIKRIQLETGVQTTKAKNIDPATLPGIVQDDTAAEVSGNWKKSTSAAPFLGATYLYSNSGAGNGAVRYTIKVPSSGEYQVQVSYSPAGNRASRACISIQHADGTSDVFLNQKETPPEQVFAAVGKYSFNADEPATVVVDAAKSVGGVVVADAVRLLQVDSLPTGSSDKEERALLLAELTELQKRLDKHGKSKPAQPVTLSVKDQKEPADGHVHIRGGIRNKGDIVPRGFLSVASPVVDDSGIVAAADISAGDSGRRELAEWIASPDNPLTARVYVNRVWMHLIGEGLVRTPDNFGVTGTPPTHPQLLDYLAATFISDDNWSTKSLIRRIVTSRIFRMSSQSIDNDQDPENQLLSRAFRRQLDAEALRDGILQISDQLDLTVTSGRTISKISTYDGNYDHNSGSPNIRSVYVPFLRNAILETLDVFDTANPNIVSGRRNLTVLPGQALYMMNSPFVADQAMQAAEKFLSQQTDTTDNTHDMIEQATMLVLGRIPTEGERTVLSALLSGDGTEQQTWTAVFHALFGSIDFRFVD